MLNIGVLVSGGGTNLQAILDAQQAGRIPDGQVTVVISSKPGVYALERARKAGVDGVVCSRKDLGSQEAFEQAILQELEKRQVGLLVLAGFMSILSADFIRQYENRILNVHPALIPSFCGKGFYGLRVHERFYLWRQAHRGDGAFCQRGNGRWPYRPSKSCGCRGGGYPGSTAAQGDGTGGMEDFARGGGAVLRWAPEVDGRWCISCRNKTGGREKIRRKKEAAAVAAATDSSFFR